MLKHSANSSEQRPSSVICPRYPAQGDSDPTQCLWMLRKNLEQDKLCRSAHFRRDLELSSPEISVMTSTRTHLGCYRFLGSFSSAM